MHYDDVQIRLIILYTLKEFEISMPQERLFEVLVWSEVLDYFTMMDFILDMQDLGMITTVEIEGKICYDITAKGRELLGYFKDKIPLSVRDNILDSAEKTLSTIARGQEIVADIVPIDTRKYLVKCGLYERGVPLLEINLFAGSRKSAEAILARFQNGSADLYKTILEKIVE